MLEFVQTQFTPVTETFKSMSLDVFIIAGVVALLFFFGLWRGKSSLAALFASLPLAGFAFSLFPFKSKITFLGESASQIAWSRAIFFGVLLALMYVLLSRIISVSSYYSAGAKKWFDVGLISFAAALVLIVLYYHVLGISGIHTFGPSVHQAFGNAEYAFWWFLASLIAFFVAVRR